MHTVVFYHHHVNGDSLFARLLLAQLGPLTEKYKCYICTPRTHGPVFADVVEKEFIYSDEWIDQCPASEQFHSKDGVLFVDMWIGWATPTCCFCLKNVVDYYNTLLRDLSNHVGIEFEPITDRYPYVEFDYGAYNCDWVDRALDIDRPIVAVYNMQPQTFPKTQIPERIISDVALERPDVLYVTFIPTVQDLPDNVVSFDELAREQGMQLTGNYAVEFSRLCVDPRVVRVFTCASGVCQFSFQRSMSPGKLLMVQEFGNPEAPVCRCDDGVLCTKTFGLDCAVVDVNSSDCEDIIRNHIVPPAKVDTTDG